MHVCQSTDKWGYFELKRGVYVGPVMLGLLCEAKYYHGYNITLLLGLRL